MINPDIRITDLDAVQLDNLFKMIRPEAGAHARLFIVYQGDRILKAVHTGRGRLPGLTVWDGPQRLAEWAETESADFVAAMAPDTIRKIAFEFQSRLSLDQTFDQQLLLALKAAARRLGRDLHIYPDNLVLARMLPYELLELLGKLILPARKGTAAFFVFDDVELHASLILGFEDRQLSLVTSYDAIEAMHFDFLDWRVEHQDLARTVEREFGKLHLGIFVDKAWLDQTRDRGLEFGDLLAAVRDKKIALHPPIPTPITLLILKLLRRIPAREPDPESAMP